MLVIRRRQGESILIGADIEVEVIEVGPGRVKLGIHAPDPVLILRKEIQLAERQNLAAARGLNQNAISLLVSRLRTPPVAGTTGQSAPRLR